jgi:RNA polymerase sigma-70 factor (ECF subfamily)
LYGYLRRYLGDDDLADDVFQNAFVAVFRKIRQYEPGRAARPWLYTVATNQAIDAMRRRGRRRERTSADPLQSGGDESGEPVGPLEAAAATVSDPMDAADTAETRRRVREAVDRLPDAFRQVILLVYFQGLKYQEVAEVLDVPVGTVKSRMHAAIARLSELWGGAS